MCISGGWAGLEFVTMNTNMLLYISVGSWLAKAVGSWIDLPGNRSMTFWNPKQCKTPPIELLSSSYAGLVVHYEYPRPVEAELHLLRPDSVGFLQLEQPPHAIRWVHDPGLLGNRERGQMLHNVRRFVAELVVPVISFQIAFVPRVSVRMVRHFRNLLINYPTM